MDEVINELIEATKEYHSVEDCKVEGRLTCRLCKAIEAAEQSVQPTPSGCGGSAGKRVRKSKVGLPA